MSETQEKESVSDRAQGLDRGHQRQAAWGEVEEQQAIGGSIVSHSAQRSRASAEREAAALRVCAGAPGSRIFRQSDRGRRLGQASVSTLGGCGEGCCKPSGQVATLSAQSL